MRNLILLLCLTFTIISVNAQKISKKEATAYMSSLSQTEKLALLADLMKDDAKTLDKTLLKALRKADRTKVGIADKASQKADKKVKKGKKAAAPVNEVTTPPTSTEGSPRIVPMTADRQKVQKVEEVEVIKEVEEVVKPAETAIATPATPAQPTYTFVDKSVGPTTTISVDEETFDFGTINDGDVVTHVFKITNTGSEPLVISNAKGSCGCTVPEWPRDAIAPGQHGEIKVTFNSSGKGAPGEGSNQHKRVTLTANTDPVNTYLSVKGIVIKQ